MGEFTHHRKSRRQCCLTAAVCSLRVDETQGMSELSVSFGDCHISEQVENDPPKTGKIEHLEVAQFGRAPALECEAFFAAKIEHRETDFSLFSVEQIL